jgi:hypothetical protein
LYDTFFKAASFRHLRQCRLLVLLSNLFIDNILEIIYHESPKSVFTSRNNKLLRRKEQWLKGQKIQEALSS